MSCIARNVFAVPVGTRFHAPPENESRAPFAPTAHEPLEVLRTPNSAGPPLIEGDQRVPSKCTIRPPSPTAHALVGEVTATAESAAGERLAHGSQSRPSKW